MRTFLHARIHCFNSPAQQRILYLPASYGDAVNDRCTALSNEGVMNRWWCVRLSLSLMCWQRQKHELWTASVSTAWFGWWSGHILWQIGKGKYSRQWRLRDEAAGVVSQLFFFPVLRLMRTRSRRGELELTVKLGQLFTFEFFFLQVTFSARRMCWWKPLRGIRSPLSLSGRIIYSDKYRQQRLIDLNSWFSHWQPC